MDDARIMMRIAESRSVNKIEDPSLREFLQEPLARLYPEQYHRLLEIELMASISCCRSRPDFALSRWLEAQQLLEALLRACGSQDELLAAVCAEDRKDLRRCLVIWSLLDRASPHVSAEESTFDFLEAAEGAVLTRLEEEGNPRGSRRRDATTDLYGICLAMLGNRLRVRGDVMGGFELNRKAYRMVRPGGNAYTTGKVCSFVTSAAISMGLVEPASKSVVRALEAFQAANSLRGISEIANLLHHIYLLCGFSSRDLLLKVLARQRERCVPDSIVVVTQINLVGALIYFHGGVGAWEILRELESRKLSNIMQLWVKQFQAILLLNEGHSRSAAREFRRISCCFIEVGQPNQAYFVSLFEALSYFESGKRRIAAEKAKSAAEFFLSTRFYGNLASEAAKEIGMAAKAGSIDRQTVLMLIDIVLSPAKARLTGQGRSYPFGSSANP